MKKLYLLVLLIFLNNQKRNKKTLNLNFKLQDKINVNLYYNHNDLLSVPLPITLLYGATFQPYYMSLN